MATVLSRSNMVTLLPGKLLLIIIHRVQRDAKNVFTEFNEMLKRFECVKNVLCLNFRYAPSKSVSPCCDI
jgi:hypothetical protein